MKGSFNLSDWALKHQSFVWYLMFVALLMGVFSYMNLGREEDPSFTIKTMVIQTRWPGALGWTTNRLLLPAAGIELTFSLVVLFVVPFANGLGHAPPPAAGWGLAVLSMVAVLAVDAADKHLRAGAAENGAGPGSEA